MTVSLLALAALGMQIPFEARLRPGRLPHRQAPPRCCMAMSEHQAEKQFRSWLQSSAPPGAQAAECEVRVSEATTVEGALRDVWSIVNATAVPTAQTGEARPPATVLLLPEVSWLQPWERMDALNKYVLACRDCCNEFGTAVRVQALHPDTQPEPPDGSEIEAERLRAPCAAFSISRRVGPCTLRPPEDVDEARALLEQAFRSSDPEADVGVASTKEPERVPSADPSAVLAETVSARGLDGEGVRASSDLLEYAARAQSVGDADAACLQSYSHGASRALIPQPHPPSCPHSHRLVCPRAHCRRWPGSRCTLLVCTVCSAHGSGGT